MDENRYYYQHHTYTSNVSDDSSVSSCGIPLPAPYFTEARRRKSRLGQRITRTRVLQDLKQNPTNNEPESKHSCDERIPSNFSKPDIDFVKPLDLVSDVNFNEDADSFCKLDRTNNTNTDLNKSPKLFMNPIDLDLIPDVNFSDANSFSNLIPFSNTNTDINASLKLLSDLSESPEMLIDFNTSPKKSTCTKTSCKLETPRTSIQMQLDEPLNYSLPKTEPMSIDQIPEVQQNSSSSKESENISNEKSPKDDEFKRPENLPPPCKEDKKDFHFEPPLPVPPNPKSSDQLPPFISVKGKSYSVVNILGSGGSSMVYQVLHPENNETLAIKRVNLSEVDETIAEGYIDEVKLLKSLQKSEFIIKMFDHEIIYENSKKLLHVVMEKGDTDLSELIRNINKTKKLSILMILYYWHEMLSAVFEIHNSGIIHSDLKPANFLLVKGRLKLIDFGIASSIQGDMTSVYKDVFTGTLNYMSPEAVQFVNCSSGSIGYKITYKTDVWSLGCILYNLIYGRLPFQHLKKKWDKMRAIVDPNVKIEFPEVKGVPSVLMQALKSCLDKDPKIRMSVKELLQLPYCGN